MDRYGTYTEYLAAKLNIIGDPQVTGKVIVGEVDPEAEVILRRLWPAAGGAARLARVARPDPPVELSAPGDHNQMNAACVLAVCSHLGLDEDVVRDALRSFKGLPHRLEHIRTLDGVDYFNDSKSTSPAATATAIATLKQPIVAIIGGQEVGRLAGPDRLNDPARLRTGFPSRERERPVDTPRARAWGSDLRGFAEALVGACRLVICIGESGPAFARTVREGAGARWAGARLESRTSVREVDGLEAAVRLARAEAEPGEAVLFSPGAPSFDDYVNFAERGRHFVDAVNALSPPWNGG